MRLILPVTSSFSAREPLVLTKTSPPCAGLPHKLFWVDAETGRSSVPMGEFANKAEAEAAASASDIELLRRCANDEACRVEVQTGFWQARCVDLNQHGTR